MFVKLVIALLAIFIIKLILTSLQYWINILKIPGSFKQPSTKDFYSSLLKRWESANFGTFKYVIGSKPFVFFTEPATVKILLLEKSATEPVRSEDFHRNKSILEIESDSTVQKLKQSRQIFTAAFGEENMEKYVSVFNSSTNIFLKNLDNSAQNIQKLVTCLSFNIFCESFMGINCDDTEYDARSNKVITTLLRLEEIHRRRSISLIQGSDLLYSLSPMCKDELACISIVQEFCEDVIKCRKYTLSGALQEYFDKSVDSRKTNCKSVLDQMLYFKTEYGLPLRSDIIRQEIINAMYFSVGPSSSAINFTLYCLASNPEVQEKVFQEQVNVLGSNGGKEAIWSDLKSMKYLEKVVKESLRLYAPTPFVARHLVNDVKTPDGHFIPSGTNVVAFLGALGINPKHHKNPKIFDHERTIPENSFTSLPFGLGPRNCIGEKLSMNLVKCVVSKVVRKCEILQEKGHNSELELEAGSFLRAKNGISIKFRNR